jgi:hypothetical protein
MDHEAFYNLTAFADRLVGEGRKIDLAWKIRNAVDPKSIEVDLVLASDACDALAFSLDNPMQQPANFRETSEAALFSYIVVLYARATKSESDVRKQYDPRSKFNAEEKKAHLELCDLRDKAVAHFGHGGSYVGNWNTELAVADSNYIGVRPAIITRRLIVDRKLLVRARNHILRTLEIIIPVCVKRIEDFTDALNAEFETDPNFYEEVQQHPLNAAIFLGGAEQVAQMRAGRAAGHARGSFGHS